MSRRRGTKGASLERRAVSQELGDAARLAGAALLAASVLVTLS